MVKSGFSDLRLNALFISVTFLGMLIGAGFAGYLGDRFGRRSSYQTNLADFRHRVDRSLFRPKHELALIALRLIMGIGLGAELVVAAGTLCEFIPPASRGRWTALLAVHHQLRLAGVDRSGLRRDPPHLGWRYMFAIAGVGAIIVWVLRHRMPESPRWLESVGRAEEAEATVSAIEHQVSSVKRNRRHRVSLAPKARKQPKAPFSALFSHAVCSAARWSPH